MQKPNISAIFLLLMLLSVLVTSHAQVYEISGSPFDTQAAPLPQRVNSNGEKVILVDPSEHVWGAYRANGKLIRWGIASAGRSQCADSSGSCRTKTGAYRIYSLGNSNCVSNKYEGAPMPYCMYFSGGDALHGSDNVEFENISHGCVRVHVDDAKWLRYHFVEGPTAMNHFQGTKIIIKAY